MRVCERRETMRERERERVCVCEGERERERERERGERARSKTIKVSFKMIAELRSKIRLGELGAATPIIPILRQHSAVFSCNNWSLPKLCLLFHFPKL